VGFPEEGKNKGGVIKKSKGDEVFYKADRQLALEKG